MSAAFVDQVTGQLALGEQVVGRDGVAGDVQSLEQVDGHAELVGLFAFFGTVNVKDAYFGPS